jgi:hypothetical protein
MKIAEFSTPHMAQLNAERQEIGRVALLMSYD